MKNEQTKTIASHRHGQGKRAREAWGRREDCGECSRYDAMIEQARADMQRRAAQGANR